MTTKTTTPDTVIDLHDIQAEKALLASILQGYILPADLQLSPDDFYIRRHGWIFAAIMDIYRSGNVADMVTLPDLLEEREQLKEIGGSTYLMDLNGLAYEEIHPSNALYFCDKIVDCANRRQLIDTLSKASNLAYDTKEPGTYLEAVQLLKTFENGRGQQIIISGSTWGAMDQIIGPIEWSWQSWLPIGFLTMLVSESGTGKSALALRIAGCFLRGDMWPDGTPFNLDTGKILWCEAEAAQALNLSRAKAWGLPIEQILTPLDDPLQDIELDNPEHQGALISMAQRDEVKFIIVDSLSGGTRKDRKQGADMMTVIKLFAELARNTGKPVMVTHHLRKRGVLDVGDRITIERVRDSSEIVQLARVIWALDTPDPEDTDNRRAYIIKNNLARFAEPIGLRVNEDGITFGDAPEPPKQESLQDKAADLLLSLLAKGPIPATNLQQEIEQAGLSWHTAKKAKEKLGIVSTRAGGIWHWGLPQFED